jgi:uncharacterized protein HemX
VAAPARVTAPARPTAPSRAAAPPPAGRPATVPRPRTPVRLVPQPPAPRPSGTATFVASCAGLLVATLVALLALNVAASGNAFTLSELTTEADRLRDAEESLRLSVAEEAAPQRLDSRARGLGMVPAEAPEVLVLPERSPAPAAPPGPAAAPGAGG